MTLTEKTAYIKGLMEGLDFKADTPEKKILAAVIDLLDDVAIAVTEAEEDIEYLNDYVEELDDDLQAVEDFLDEEIELDEDDLDDEDWDDEDWDDEGCDGDCDSCDGSACADDDYFEIVCPSCGDTVCFDQELDPENLRCPACGEKFGCIVDEDDLKKIDD